MFEGMSTAEIVKLLLPLIVIEFGLKVFCLYRLSKDDVKYLPKWGWVLIILFVSTFGSLSYLIFGRVKD